MTPQEKAKDLVNKMKKDFQYFASKEIAKQHALIAVNEILETIWEYHLQAEWWQEVKQEIKKICN